MKRIMTRSLVLWFVTFAFLGGIVYLGVMTVWHHNEWVQQPFNGHMASANGLGKAGKIDDRKIEEIRGEKGVPNVIIKGTDEGTYTNLIDCLDEMLICDIGKYVIVPIDDFDREMIEYCKKNGSKSSDSAQ